jgi:hypothetical protein
MSGLALTLPSQLSCVADSNVSAPDHETIQSERAAESPHDIRQHLTILFQTVRIKRRHDAAPAEILDSDDDLSDVQALPGPRALSQILNPTDDQIRSQPPTVMPECRNRSIRRHQQREHVKAIAGVVAYQHGTRPNDVLNIHADIGVAPQPAIDHRLAGPIKGGTVTEQPVVRSSRDHMTLGILHMHDAVSLDAEWSDTRML